MLARRWLAGSPWQGASQKWISSRVLDCQLSSTACCRQVGGQGQAVFERQLSLPARVSTLDSRRAFKLSHHAHPTHNNLNSTDPALTPSP